MRTTTTFAHVSEPREPTLLKIIQADFKKNPALKEQCIRESRASILKDKGARAFDYFEHVISAQRLATFSHVFTVLLEHKSGLSLENEIKELISLFKDTVIHGCKDIFNAEGKIQEAFLQEMQWKDLEGEINSLSLMTGFILGVMQQLQMDEAYLKVRDNNPESVAAWNIVINGDDIQTKQNEEKNNYKKWTKDAMRELGVPFIDLEAKEQKPSRKIDLLAIPKKHPVKTGIGVGVVAGLMVGGFALFAAVMAKQDTNKAIELTKQFRM